MDMDWRSLVGRIVRAVTFGALERADKDKENGVSTGKAGAWTLIVGGVATVAAHFARFAGFDVGEVPPLEAGVGLIGLGVTGLGIRKRQDR